MKPIENFLNGVMPVTARCLTTFAPFYEARQARFVYPVFNESIVEMVSEGCYFYKIFDIQGRETLCVLKRSSIMGNYSLIMYFAPISKVGNTHDEIQVMQHARKVGITLRLFNDDLRYYKIPTEIATRVGDYVDFIYDANEQFLHEGSKYRTFRNRIKAVQKLNGYRHVYGITPDVESLMISWDKHHKEEGADSAHAYSYWKRAKEIPYNESIVYHSIYIGDKIACFSCLEKFSPRHWGIIMRYRNYDLQINDVCSCMHYLDCAEVHDERFTSVYLNIGMGGNNKGLCDAKEKLHPCKHLQPYRIGATHKIDIEAARRVINECK